MLLSVGLFVIAKVFVKLYPGFFLPKDESSAARDSSNEKTQESAKTLVSTLTFSSWRNGGAQEDPEKKIAPQEAQSEDSNSSNGSELSDSLKSSSQSRSFSDESAQVDQPQDCRVRREGSKFSDMVSIAFRSLFSTSDSV